MAQPSVESNSQTESKFRIIKTDSLGNRSSLNADQLDSSHQTDEGEAHSYQQIQTDANSSQYPAQSNLNMIGNYQRRGRWLVKDFSPDQLKSGPAIHPNTDESQNHVPNNINQNRNLNKYIEIVDFIFLYIVLNKFKSPMEVCLILRHRWC